MNILITQLLPNHLSKAVTVSTSRIPGCRYFIGNSEIIRAPRLSQVFEVS